MHIALIGYGEVGRIFGNALAAKAPLRAFDIAVTNEMRARAARDRIELTASAAQAVAAADLVISAVTAHATREAAISIAGAMRAPCRARVQREDRVERSSVWRRRSRCAAASS